MIHVNLFDFIDLSASIIRTEQTIPCTRDVNHDGETDLSDAAHMLKLAVAPPPSGLVDFNHEAIEDCFSVCSRI